MQKCVDANIEQQMSMNAANIYWLETLHNCKLDQSLSLPFDRYRLSNEHRTGRGTTISIDFSEDLSRDIVAYSSSNNMTLEHFALASYYAFLFKLTNGQKDLCIGMNTHGRYKEELMSIIGMFVNAIPLRCQLNPHWSFQQLVKHVEEIITNSIEYSYFPLQRILAQHPNITKPAFLDTSFVFYSTKNKNSDNGIMIGSSKLYYAPFSIKISEDEIMSKFDFALTITHDLSINQLSCRIDASIDLFNFDTVVKISQRFHSILEELFQFTTINQMQKQIYQLSMTLPDEKILMQSINNTQIPYRPISCIHHEFISQVIEHPQKLAVELDDQSLTYTELLNISQILAITLLNTHQINPGEIICQCVERSLSMVIGIMTIEMIGGVYFPLSSHDPEHRLHSLIQQTQSRFVVVHWLTNTKFDNDIILMNINSIVINNKFKIDIDCLSKISVKLENIAYVIFTSGSTGTPKAVSFNISVDERKVVFYWF